jgi:hypothetical protein
LSLLDKELLIFRFVYPLCGPFQYSFHGLTGVWTTVKPKGCGGIPLVGGFYLFCTNNKLFTNRKASG